MRGSTSSNTCAPLPSTYNIFPTSLDSEPSSHQCITTIDLQNSYASSLLLAGDFLFMGLSNKQIHLWKCSRSSISGDCKDDCDDHSITTAGNGIVKALVMSSDKLISAHQDHKIRVWKIDSAGQKAITHLATLPTLSDRALNILVPKNHVQVRRHKKQTWIHHVDAVSALALSCDESLLYSVSWDRTLKIWSTDDFKCLESVPNAHDDAINAVALSADGHVYTASSDRSIKVWKQNPGRNKHSLIATLERHGSAVNALALSRDGTVLYSGAADRSILAWRRVDSGMEEVGTLSGHTKSILCLATLSDSVLCSGSADKTVRVWTRVGESHSCLAVIEGHKGPIKCITGVYDDHSDLNQIATYLVYSASLGCDVKAWKVFVPVS